MTIYSAKRCITGLTLLVMLGLMACSFVESPPAELIAKQDHVALAALYQNEAVRLRQKAKEIRWQRNTAGIGNEPSRECLMAVVKSILSNNVGSSPQRIQLRRAKLKS